MEPGSVATSGRGRETNITRSNAVLNAGQRASDPVPLCVAPESLSRYTPQREWDQVDEVEALKTRSFTSRGLELVVHEWGNPAGPPLLLIHGFLDHGRSFHALGEGLEASYRLIAPDLRGHGLSGRVGQGGTYWFPDYLLDLDALFTEMNLDSVHVAGHSMGASVGIYLAGSHPERVASLILLDGMAPPEGDAEKGPRALRKWVEAVRRLEHASPTGSADLDGIARRLGRMSPRADADLLRRLAPDACYLADDGLYYFHHDPIHRAPMAVPFDGARLDVFLRAVACPTLVVWAEHTPFKPAEADARVALLRDARVVTVPGAGHNLHHEQPQATAEVISAFLNGLLRP